MPARAEVTPLEKALLIGCARRWAATATSDTRGACVVSADQAPRRARSMGARGSGIFNGVTQSASLFAFQRSHQRHSWYFNVTRCISEPLARHSLRFTGLLDAVPERAERSPAPRTAPRSPAHQTLWPAVQSPASRLPDGGDDDSPGESDISSDGDAGDEGGRPLDRGASEPDRAELAARLCSLWGEFRVAVRSPRDYRSVLTMIRDATADFWCANLQ